MARHDHGRRLLHPRPWTVPAVELIPASPVGASILSAGGGRASDAAEAAELLRKNEDRPRDFLFAILIAGLGERPLGLETSQVLAAARWLKHRNPHEAIGLVVTGRRSSLFALIAAALDEEEAPELFCFGLLECFDIPQLG